MQPAMKDEFDLLIEFNILRATNQRFGVIVTIEGKTFACLVDVFLPFQAGIEMRIWLDRLLLDPDAEMYLFLRRYVSMRVLRFYNRNPDWTPAKHRYSALRGRIREAVPTWQWIQIYNFCHMPKEIRELMSLTVIQFPLQTTSMAA